jgi:hypothetical protein
MPKDQWAVDRANKIKREADRQAEYESRRRSKLTKKKKRKLTKQMKSSAALHNKFCGPPPLKIKLKD